MWLPVLVEQPVETAADELSVYLQLERSQHGHCCFKQPAAFSLATGAAAASPTATVQQECGGRRSQEVRAVAQRPPSPNHRPEGLRVCPRPSIWFVCIGVQFLSASVSRQQPGFVN